MNLAGFGKEWAGNYCELQYKCHFSIENHNFQGCFLLSAFSIEISENRWHLFCNSQYRNELYAEVYCLRFFSGA